MRYLFIALLAFPVYAQAPVKRGIGYECSDQECRLSRVDWEWIVSSMNAKDKEIALHRYGCGPWRPS